MMFETVKEWLYRKRMIHPLSLLDTLADAECVIAPKFISVGEYIFLDCGNENLQMYGSYPNTYEDKVGVEALENHVHLFDDVPSYCREDVKHIAIAIAENLLRCLKKEFPEKEFAVFLELKYTESVIVRFHQIREKEALYLDPELCKEGYVDGTLMLFR